MLFALALLGSQTQAKIDFDVKAMQVAPLLAQLSKQTGSKLTANARIGQQILFIRAHEVTLPDLKARIAEALDATWSKVDDREILERTPGQDKALWTKHLAARRKLVDVALGRAKKDLEKPFDAKTLAAAVASLPTQAQTQADPAAARRSYEVQKSFASKAPMSRFLNRLLLAANPDDLAAVGPYERAVFRVKPTKRQKGIAPSGYDAAVAAFAKEQALWIDAAAQLPSSEGSSTSIQDPRAGLNVSPGDVANVKLELIRGDAAGLFYANLYKEQQSGFSFPIAQNSYSSPEREFLDGQMNAKPPGEDDPLVDLSPDSKAFQARLTEIFVSAQPNAPKPEILSLLMSADTKDILSFAVSDGLMAFAQSKNQNMVASLPDSAFAIAAFLSTTHPVHVKELVDALTRSGTLDFSEKGSWTLATPTDRVEADLQFTPRAPVATLIKAVTEKGRLDVRDYAKYAYGSGRISRMGLGDWYLMLLDRAFLAGVDHTDWNGLRLFGSFSEAEQGRLISGERFAFPGLRSDQRAIVDRIVYSGEIRSEVQAGGGASTTNRAPLEPTEAYANGLPAKGAVAARSRDLQVLVAYSKGTDGKTRPLRSVNVGTLAYIEQEVVGNPAKMAAYWVPGLVGYAPGTDVLLTLRVELDPGLWKEIAMTVPNYDSRATPLPWTKLPEPYPAQIKDAIEQEKKRKAQEAGTVIPPRP